MSITVRTITPAKVNPPGKTFFHLSGTSADASGAETLKAAPASGSIYIERMTVYVGAAITVTIGSGIDTGAVETIAWDLPGIATGVVYQFVFLRPVKLVALKAFAVDASGAGDIVVEAEGFVS